MAWFYNRSMDVRVCGESGLVQRKYLRLNKRTGKSVIVWKDVDAQTLAPVPGKPARRVSPEDAQRTARRAF